MVVLIRRTIGALTVAALLAGGAAACSTTGSNAIGSKGYAAGDGAVVTIPAEERELAPVLSGELLGGGSADLSQSKGKVVVLNVWAAWCGPCREEAPALAEADRLLPDAAFYGIDTKDDAATAEAFVRSNAVPYPSFFDQDGSLVLDLQSVVNVQARPSTVVLDEQGRVAASIAGPTTAITLKDIVQSLEQES